MPSLAVLKVLLRELSATKHDVPRVPEPDLVMDDPDKVAAYTRAGRVDGVMAPVYLFHCVNICEVIKPGDKVIDLACGPATQLAQVARLNPDVEFTGIDLSLPMLDRAKAHIDELGLRNVRLAHGSITELEGFAAGSVDAVMSTMALHHLPDVRDLHRTFAEVGRVLRNEGGIYLVDFGRLRTKASIKYFAYQYADRQPELFTQDYFYSLNAAFLPGDFRDAAAALSGRARFYATFGFPMMMALKSRPRRSLDTDLLANLRREFSRMPAHHQADFRDLKTFFGLGGLRTANLSA